MKIEKYKKRIKKYFTQKPKSSFWMWAFIVLFLFKYVTPTVLPFLLMFQLGLVSGEMDVDAWQPKMENISINLADKFMDVNERLILAGNKLAREDPLIAKILFYGFGYFVWVIWFAMITLALQLCRYGISYVYRRSRKSGKK